MEARAVIKTPKHSCKNNHLSQKDQMVLDYLPLVKFLAQRLAAKLPPSIEVNDLISAGVIGLMDAVERFESARGIQFKTYADSRIRGAMIDSLRALDWAPRSLRKKERAVELAYHRLEQKLGRTVGAEEVAEELGVSLDTLQDWIMDIFATANEVSLMSCPRDEEGETTDLIEYVPDNRTPDPFLAYSTSEIQILLASSLLRLPEKERFVMEFYYYEELTMKEIGRLLGVNESRISQLHGKAIIRLRAKLSRHMTQVRKWAKAS